MLLKRSSPTSSHAPNALGVRKSSTAYRRASAAVAKRRYLVRLGGQTLLPGGSGPPLRPARRPVSDKLVNSRQATTSNARRARSPVEGPGGPGRRADAFALARCRTRSAPKGERLATRAAAAPEAKRMATFARHDAGHGWCAYRRSASLLPGRQNLEPRVEQRETRELTSSFHHRSPDFVSLNPG